MKAYNVRLTEVDIVLIVSALQNDSDSRYEENKCLKDKLTRRCNSKTMRKNDELRRRLEAATQ